MLQVVRSTACRLSSSRLCYNNARLMLLSGIGKPHDPKTGEGVIGRNYAIRRLRRNRFLQDQNFNPAVGWHTVIDDFNGDNFDHGPLGFIGGASSALSSRVVCH